MGIDISAPTFTISALLRKLCGQKDQIPLSLHPPTPLFPLATNAPSLPSPAESSSCKATSTWPPLHSPSPSTTSTCSSDLVSSTTPTPSFFLTQVPPLPKKIWVSSSEIFLPAYKSEGSSSRRKLWSPCFNSSPRTIIPPPSLPKKETSAISSENTLVR
jgi:hypothetical protein